MRDLSASSYRAVEETCKDRGIALVSCDVGGGCGRDMEPEWRWAYMFGKWSPWISEDDRDGEEASDLLDATELCLLRGSLGYPY